MLHVSCCSFVLLLLKSVFSDLVLDLLGFIDFESTKAQGPQDHPAAKGDWQKSAEKSHNSETKKFRSLL